MKPHDVIGAIFLLIMTFLVVANWQGTTAVIQALGVAATTETEILQGRGTVLGGGNAQPVSFNGNKNGLGITVSI